MSNHFVESHSGGFYFSSENPDIIQECGEDYGNGDNIIFTYDDEDLEEPLKSLSEYFSRNLVFTRDKLIEKLNACNMEYIGVDAAVTEVKCNAIYDIDNNKDMIKILFDENKITKEMYDKLIEILDDKLRKQLEFIRNIDKISLNIMVYKKKEKKKEN